MARMNAYGLVHKISPVASFSSSDLKIPVGLFTQPTRPHCGKCQRNLILAEESKKLLDETNHKLIGERVEKEELKLKIRVLEELVGSMKKLQRLGGDSGSPGAWEHPDDRFQSSSYSSWPFDTNLNLDLSGESSIKVEPLEIIDDAAPARGPLEEVEPVEICENYNVADEFSETPGDHNHSCPSESAKVEFGVETGLHFKRPKMSQMKILNFNQSLQCIKDAANPSTISTSSEVNRDKNFGCKMCYLGFPDPAALSEHEQNAEHGKRFTCRIGQWKFKKRIHLTRHEEQKHPSLLRNGEGTTSPGYECKKCGKRFRNVWSCKRHESNIKLHEQMAIPLGQCYICSKQLARRNGWALDQHLATKHSKEQLSSMPPPKGLESLKALKGIVFNCSGEPAVETVRRSL